MKRLPRGVKAKDASTRFMHVDQLGAARTVAVPAAQLLAAAAASAAPEAKATASCIDEAPTVAMAASATLPAATVVRRRLDRTATATATAPPPRASAPTRARWSSRLGEWRTVRPHARTLALATLLTGVVAVVTWTETRRSDGGAKLDVGRAAAPPAPVATTTASPARTLPRPSTAASPGQPVPDEIHTEDLPASAADQLAAGDYAAALVSYRQLSRAWPDERAFTLVAQVLERKLNARCTADATLEGDACQR